MRLQRLIALDARRRFVRAPPSRIVLILGGWGDRQDAADRLDPVRGAMIVNESDHGLNRRSSSA
jgi:hypothetical protein